MKKILAWASSLIFVTSSCGGERSEPPQRSFHFTFPKHQIDTVKTYKNRNTTYYWISKGCDQNSSKIVAVVGEGFVNNRVQLFKNGEVEFDGLLTSDHRVGHAKSFNISINEISDSYLLIDAKDTVFFQSDSIFKNYLIYREPNGTLTTVVQDCPLQFL